MVHFSVKIFLQTEHCDWLLAAKVNSGTNKLQVWCWSVNIPGEKS